MKRLFLVAFAATAIAAVCGCKTDAEPECDDCRDCGVEFPVIERWWK